MGEIIDLEAYRRQRKRRLVATKSAASRRGGGRPERDRLRPAVEPLDRGRGGADPAADANRDEKAGD